jgi:ribulose-5-phosphate 4-epimerase/fuculose-1-phosphate aldolase
VAAAVKIYPRSPAVLVRNHGIYVWGKNWEKVRSAEERSDEALRIFMGDGPTS